MLKPSKKPLITKFSISPLGGLLQHFLLAPWSGFLSGCGFLIGEADQSRVWKPFLPSLTPWQHVSIPALCQCKLILPAFLFGQVGFQLGQPCDPSSLCSMNICTEQGMELGKNPINEAKDASFVGSLILGQLKPRQHSRVAFSERLCSECTLPQRV